MTRTRFFQLFEQVYPTCGTGATFRFDIDVMDSDDKIEFEHEVLETFADFFECLGTFKHDSAQNLPAFFKFISLKKEYDAYFEEDNPESAICRYNCKINIHELYDQFILQSSFPLRSQDIYRIENQQGAGLYSSVFASKPVNFVSQPSPYEDPSLNTIFNSKTTGLDYARQWSFAFKDIDSAKAWFSGHEAMLDTLDSQGFVLKKITMPTSFVIEGEKQVIFQPAQKIYDTSLSLDTLKECKTFRL